MTTDETLEYETLRCLAKESVSSQRTLAESLGVSLGKANYVVRTLVARGLVTVENISGKPSRLGYSYLLTPKGIAEKAKLTRRFLKRKIREYERLQKEIDSLSEEAGVTGIRAVAG